MKKLISCLLALIFCAGCSCTPDGSMASPTPSSTPLPSNEPETAASAKDYLDYLSEKYTLMDPKQLDQLDGNTVDGYSFGMNNQTYYLIQLDPTQEQAAKWMSEMGNSGQIEVDIDGLPKTMTARMNGNFALISDTADYVDGFQEYFDAFAGAQALNPATPTPSPSA